MTLPAVLCFSHLRWTGELERPSHLMLRCARHHRVFFIEEPVIDATYAEVIKLAPNLWRVVPHLSDGCSEQELHALWRGQLAMLRAEHRIERPILWYYTPAAVPVSLALPSSATVYDCIHDLTEQHETAIPGLLEWERELVQKADLVLVGTPALRQAKASVHANVHEIPNSIDIDFFAQARIPGSIPQDQVTVPGPRVGYAGRIDQRIDLGLLDRLARLRPHWHFVLLGAVDSSLEPQLPRHANLHYLGPKEPSELPAYLADWDAAILPFGSAGERFLNPCTALQYLAAGKPVVATSVSDTVAPYATLGLLRLANGAESFAAELDAALGMGDPCGSAQRDEFLAQASWDGTWLRIHRLMLEALLARRERASSMPLDPHSQPRTH